MRNFNNNALKGRTALITGGGGLLGPHHGIGLSSAGAKVVIADIDSKGLEISKNKILESNDKAKVETIILDITDLDAVQRFQQIYTSKNGTCYKSR